ncbi:MAG TPA: hypothetical protein EYG81_05190 [Archaeoglobus profundus]|nr:hypothetical protein [Archaeoglobus profundus]
MLLSSLLPTIFNSFARQVKFIAHVIKKLSNLKKPMEIRKLIDYVNKLVYESGFSAFVKPVPPYLTVADGFDVVWTLNRMYNAIFITKVV